MDNASQKIPLSWLDSTLTILGQDRKRAMSKRQYPTSQNLKRVGVELYLSLTRLCFSQKKFLKKKLYITQMNILNKLIHTIFFFLGAYVRADKMFAPKTLCLVSFMIFVWYMILK